jgi:O-antigen/teichoic acid export membrane protein
MTDKQQQIRNSIYYFLPLIVSSLIPIIVLPIFTRILSKEDYGAFALAGVYAVFVCGIANSGLTPIFNRNFFKYRDSKKASELFYSILAFVATTLSIFGFITYLFLPPISKLVFGSTQNEKLLFFSYCLSGITIIKSYYLNYFRNSENAKRFVWYTINTSILSTLFSFYLVVYLRIGVLGLVLGPVVASTIVLFYIAVKVIKLLPISFNWLILRESLKLSYPLIPQTFIGVIAGQFDKYMIGLLSTVGGVGIYSIGQQISYMIFNYITALQNVFTPQVYKKMFDLRERGGIGIGVYLTPFAYVSVAFALLVSLFSEEILTILTPKSYHGAIDIVTILSMAYAILFFGKQSQLIYAKKTHVSSILVFFRVTLIIVLNIPFILKWGAVGAAFATLLAWLISGSISFILSQHYYKIMWEYRKIVAIYGLFFVSSTLLLSLRFFDVNYLIQILLKLISVIGYIYIGIRINVLTIENFSLIKDILFGLIIWKRKEKTA